MLRIRKVDERVKLKIYEWLREEEKVEVHNNINQWAKAMVEKIKPNDIHLVTYIVKVQ